MDSPPRSASPTCDGGDPAAGAGQKDTETPSQLDPFLVEALENPRHRLTILRMELDIQRFMQNHEQHQFEFQHFPSSYLRRAAHRVAQHYGLQTTVLDNLSDGMGQIAVRKTPDSKYPAVRLTDIPANHLEHEKPEQVKIVIRTRPNSTLKDTIETGVKQSSLRTVEEREQEYDKARARIFSDSNIPVVGVSSDGVAIGLHICSSRQEAEANRKVMEEPEKNVMKDGSSRVAIFKDREKDLNDPDYDRNYDRYFRGLMPNQNFHLGPYDAFQPFCLQYEPGFSHLRQMPQTQTSVGYKPSNTIMSSYYTAACNQTSIDSLYVPWPSPAMMYAHSYEHFRNAVLQVPFCHQPLSFEHYENH
uniref:R3H domain-containing protein 1 n=1 Tax=Anthurium amnicola TaxID=1678845 RepID=A0A1D1XEC5_9ARAE